MPRLYTADQIVSSARDKSQVPDSGASGTQDQDVLDLVNDWLFDELIGEIFEVKEEYFVVADRIPVVAGLSRFRVDSRAMYQVERDIRYVNSDGNFEPRITQFIPGKIDQFAIDSSKSARPRGFYVQGNDIILWPEIDGTAGGSMEHAFPFRPGEMVLLAACRKIVSVTPATNTITVDTAVPGSWSVLNLFDVHSPFSGAEIKSWDKTAITVSGTTIVFGSTIDGAVFREKAFAVGDYVCLAGEAALPGVPVEFHPIVAQAGAVALTEKFGDPQHYQMLKARLDQKMAKAMKHLYPRVQGKPKPMRGTPFTEIQGRKYFGTG